MRILDISLTAELNPQNTELGICAEARTVLMLSAGGGVKEYPKIFCTKFLSHQRRCIELIESS